MQLKPSKLENALRLCFSAGRAPMIHGDPGIGKSQITMQVADVMFAEKYGYTVVDGRLCEVHVHAKSSQKPAYVPVGPEFQRPWLRDVRAAQLDAVDLRGLPTVNGNKRAHWATPEWLPRDARGGVVFLDEVNRGPEMVQNALFQWITEGRIGDYVMPAGWVMASAVNDKDGGARKMSSALLSRFIHIDAVTDLDDVCKLAVQRGWEPAVIAFLRFMPGSLHAYNPKERVSPNPRAWEFVSQIVAQKPDRDIEHAIFEGAIGVGAAVEFSGFLGLYRKLPSIDAILLSPGTAEVPTDPATLYAISAALGRRTTEDNFGNVVTYLERLPVEYNVFAVVDAFRRSKAIQSSPTFTQWAIRNSDVIF